MERVLNCSNEQGIKFVQGKGLQVPLTDRGKEQATNLGKLLANHLPKGGSYTILSSTAWQAQETADRIFNKLNLTHRIKRSTNDNENFCELSQGEWEGHPKDVVLKQETARWNKLSAKDKFTSPKLLTGETYQEVAHRMLEGIHQVIQQNPDQTILITTHFAAMHALTLQLSHCQLSEEPGSELPPLSINNCDILLLEVPKETLSPRVVKKFYPQNCYQKLAN